MLPDYLKFETDASANVKKSIVCGDIRFTVITSRIIRIEQGEFTDKATQSVINRNFCDAEFTADIKDGILHIKTEHLALSYKQGESLNADSLQISLLSKPYTCWHYGDNAVYNLGGTVSTLDRVSGSCPIGDGMCSIEGFSTMDDSASALFDEQGWFSARPQNITDLYFFGYGHEYLACVQDYCRLTGVPEMLPAFTLGNWWSRYHKYSDKEYLWLMDEFKKRDLPFSVAVIDMDWHLTHSDDWELQEDYSQHWWNPGWTGYTWNENLFPDYKAFLKALHDRNMAATLNLHPASGVRYWEKQYKEMAERMGIDPNTRKTVPFDCLDPKFVEAYFDVLHFPYEKDGVDFWWMDWQQGEDYHWAHDHGIEKNPLEKSISPLWMLNHIHYLASKLDEKRGLIFSRFSGHGSQRYPIGFSGDTFVTWESLDFQPYFTVTASNIGYGWWSHDIGGHCGATRDDELSTRWVQFGVFSPIFRLHSTADGYLRREPWTFEPRSEAVISDCLRLRHSLFPYIYTMNYRNYKELIPLMQPMYYTNPEEKNAYEVKNQYWFGSEMIVSPITNKADSESGLGYAKVWLPEGKWIDWFNGYIYKETKDCPLEVYRPLEQIPVFLKAGAIVPMQKHKEQDNSLGNCDWLEIAIAAGDSNSFTMYEDDGKTMNYQNGDFATTEFTLDWQENTAKFVIKPVMGNAELVPQKRNYTLVYKGFKKGCEIFLKGEKLESKYDSETNSYKVNIGQVNALKGAEIDVINQDGLIHDNSDIGRRGYEMILRAQCSGAQRGNFQNQLNSMRNSKSLRVPPAEGVNRIPLALYELAIQNI